MNNETQHGYLVLADISGYTSYLAGVELAHARDILAELLELIVERFKPLLTTVDRSVISGAGRMREFQARPADHLTRSV